MPPRKDFDRHVDKESVLPVYALVSNETVLVGEAIDELRGRVLTQAPDFNRDEFRVGDVPIERVVEAAGTVPMMAERRWVHLADLHKLKAKDAEPLVRYLSDPSPSTVLCLSASKIDSRTKLGQALNKLKAVFSFEPPKQRGLAAWIERRARKRKCAITTDAAQLLADIVGTDLGSIDMALEKLWSYVGATGDIEHADVEALVAPTRVHSIFELTDAIGARDLPKASLLLRNTIDSGESALRVLAMVTRQLRQLLQIKALGRAHPAEVARTVGVPPFLVDSLMRQADRYRAPELAAALVVAGRADERIKSTRLSHGVVLDRFLVEVMSTQGAR